MEQKNSEYWEKRIANETWKTYNAIEEHNADLLEMYDKADKSIRNELYALMEKAESDDLTRTESYKMAHLKELRSKIKKECEKLGEKVENTVTKRITKGAEDVSANIAKSFGDEFHALPKNAMEQLLRQPWHGSNFSSRLWGDTGKLVKNLDDIIANGLTQGKTATEMAVQLSNTVNKSFNEAHRLVRTEAINTLNRSTMESYKKAGVKKVQWWAAEDERTCPLCGSNHGKEFNIDKVPNLPCHPGCRCTWLPVVETNNNSEIKDRMAEQTRMLETKEKEILTQMTGALSQKINTRISLGLNLDRFSRETAILDQALAKGEISKDTLLYRKTGIRYLKSFPKDGIVNEKNLLTMLGKIETNEIYTSTSFSDWDYVGRDVNLVLFVPKGTKGALYIKELAYQQFAYQDEVLFARGLKYRYIDAKIEGNKATIFAEVIND